MLRDRSLGNEPRTLPGVGGISAAIAAQVSSTIATEPKRVQERTAEPGVGSLTFGAFIGLGKPESHSTQSGAAATRRISLHAEQKTVVETVGSFAALRDLFPKPKDFARAGKVPGRQQQACAIMPATSLCLATR